MKSVEDKSKRYTEIVERVLEKLPDRKPLVPFSGYSQQLAFDLSMPEVAFSIWSHFFIPIRWHNGSFFHLRPSGDMLDPVRVVAIPPDELPKLVSSMDASRIREFMKEINELEWEKKWLNWVLVIFLVGSVLLWMLPS